MKPIFFLFFISLGINAQTFPEKFQGYWIVSSITCDSTFGVTIDAEDIRSAFYEWELKKVVKINDDKYKVIYDTVDGEEFLVLNLKYNVLEIIRQEKTEDPSVVNTITSFYKKCK